MSHAADVQPYIDGLEPDRREMVSSLRAEILRNLPEGFQEMIDFGMVVYAVPLERYPDTYNGKPLMYAALASQKRHVSVYLMGIYSDPGTEQWFLDEYAKTGKRLDMGKSCVRFRKAVDIPLELIGRAIARQSVDSFIEQYENARRR